MMKQNISRTDVESSSKKCGKKKNKVLKQIEIKERAHETISEQIGANQDK